MGILGTGDLLSLGWSTTLYLTGPTGVSAIQAVLGIAVTYNFAPEKSIHPHSVVGETCGMSRGGSTSHRSIPVDP